MPIPADEVLEPVTSRPEWYNCGNNEPNVSKPPDTVGVQSSFFPGAAGRRASWRFVRSYLKSSVKPLLVSERFGEGSVPRRRSGDATA